MQLKDLEKGNPVVTTQPTKGTDLDEEICYVNIGRNLVGVGAFLDGSDDCVAAIITEEGKKKVIEPKGSYEEKEKKLLLDELEEAYDIFNDQ